MHEANAKVEFRGESGEYKGWAYGTSPATGLKGWLPVARLHPKSHSLSMTNQKAYLTDIKVLWHSEVHSKTGKSPCYGSLAQRLRDMMVGSRCRASSMLKIGEALGSNRDPGL